MVERITKITKSALGEDLNNMLGIEVNKDFNETILQASILAAKVGMKFADEHPHWISVEDELPKGGFAIITNGDDVLVGKYNFEKGLWGVRNKTMFAYTLLPANWKVTHWMPLPVPPTCSEKPNNCEKGGEE